MNAAGDDRWRRRKLAKNRRDDGIARLEPAAFEALVATYYRAQGYAVERVGHGGAHYDGGIDLKLRRGTEYIVVQCKRYNAEQVTHNVGHELIGVMCTQGATGAIVVNSGEFTDYARESALGDKRLVLVDGDEVRRWFPDLAVPLERAAPEWIPVNAGPSGRVRGAGKIGEGTKLALAIALLAAFVLWQWARPHRVPLAVPAVPAVPPTLLVRTEARPEQIASALPSGAKSEPQGSVKAEMTAKELAEWKRRNAESMRILQESTPEIELSPTQ